MGGGTQNARVRLGGGRWRCGGGSGGGLLCCRESGRNVWQGMGLVRLGQNKKRIKKIKENKKRWRRTGVARMGKAVLRKVF